MISNFVLFTIFLNEIIIINLFRNIFKAIYFKLKRKREKEFERERVNNV